LAGNGAGVKRRRKIMPTAIKIDPKTETVEEVFIDPSKSIVEQYREIIGCQMFTAPIRYPEGDVMFCDDEALHVEGGATYFVDSFATEVPIPGVGLLAGPENNREELQSTTFSVEEVRGRIKWVRGIFLTRLSDGREGVVFVHHDGTTTEAR
jgi:hypothetical protein